MILLGIGDWFSALLQPIRVAISWVLIQAYRFWSMITGPGSNGVTWTLAIITLTVLVRVLLIPLFVRQINSTRRMQLIQPKMKALQEKYGADREKYSIEVQKLMKAEGVNPASSCVPLLFQMPVFFALYQVLWAASQGNARAVIFEPYVEFVQEAKIFGAALAGTFWPITPWGATQTIALILILVMTALFFITQKQLMSKNMTPEAMTGPAAQQQKMMLYLFPAMYLFMGCIIQIGVLIYWVTSNLWTLGQQWLLIRNNPTPGTPAYIDWEERMIKKGKDPKAIAAERNQRISRAPKEAKTQQSATGVRRQAVETPQPKSPKSADSATENTVQRQVVQRQQPKKQSRSQRRGTTKK